MLFVEVRRDSAELVQQLQIYKYYLLLFKEKLLHVSLNLLDLLGNRKVELEFLLHSLQKLGNLVLLREAQTRFFDDLENLSELVLEKKKKNE